MFSHVDFYSNCLRKFASFSAIIPNDVPRNLMGDNPPKEGKFKTLYLLHGYSGYCNDWLLGSRIQEYAMRHNLAVIMPSGDNSFYLDDDKDMRYGEYTGKELVEYTRSFLPLSEKREDTLIGGFSMGGYGAIRNGLKYSETFGGIIALSSAMITDALAENHGDMKGAPESKEYYASIFGDPDKLIGSENDPKALAVELKKSGRPFPRIYMACGTEDFGIENNRNFKDFLKENQIDVTYDEGPGVHNWDFWDPHIEKALNWYDNK
jgi:putative tributyrin esterase